MKKLSEVCKRMIIRETNIIEDYNIEGIETDSSKIREGYIFVVTEGNEQYINVAMENGALCIISEKYYDIPCIKVDDVRKSLAIACSNFYDNPEKKLKIIGVVGTNGKTSITHMLYEIIQPFRKVCVIGTLGIYMNDQRQENGMTSPDPQVLFRVLNDAAAMGVEYVFCEITAHAIFFQKFYGIRCEMCVFTNITQDHLDFFQDMDKYSAVKKNFFTKENMKIGIINSDDAYGREIIKNSNICSVSYGITQPSDVFAIDIGVSGGLKFIANAFDDIIYVSTRFEGKFNVYNLLACIAVSRLIGVSPREIQSRLIMLKPISGRAECINLKPKVVIDFAHTPDGLKNILESLRETTDGKLIALFGCGGNRDKTKRPIMGKIASDIADVCVITSDNPRLEEPEEIIKDIVSGICKNDNYVVIQNRTAAIEFAIRLATDDDCIAICGKGGEEYMDIKGHKYPYSDKKTCMAVLEKLNCIK